MALNCKWLGIGAIFVKYVSNIYLNPKVKKTFDI